MKSKKGLLFLPILAMILAGCSSAGGSSETSSGQTTSGTTSSETSKSSSAERSSESSAEPISSSSEPISSSSSSVTPTPSSSSSFIPELYYSLSVGGGEERVMEYNSEAILAEGQLAEYMTIEVDLIKDQELAFYFGDDKLTEIGPASEADQKFIQWVGHDSVFEKLNIVKDADDVDVYLKVWGDALSGTVTGYSVGIDAHISEETFKMIIGSDEPIEMTKSDEVPLGYVAQYEGAIPEGKIVAGTVVSFTADDEAIEVEEDLYQNNIVVNNKVASFYMNDANAETLYLKVTEENEYVIYLACPADPLYSIKGSFNGWRTGLAMEEDEDNICKALQVEFKDTTSFKVKVSGDLETWYGFESIDPASTDKAVNDEGNISVPAGTYDIYLNKSEKIYIAEYQDPTKVVYPVSGVNFGFEESDVAWLKENVKAVYSSTSKKSEGKASFKLDGQITDITKDAIIYQNILGLQANDVLKLSLDICTYYNTKGARSDVFSSFKFMVGNQQVEMEGEFPGNSSAFGTYTGQATIAATDFVGNAVKIGVIMTVTPDFSSNVWGNIDNFKLGVQGRKWEAPTEALKVKIGEGAEKELPLDTEWTPTEGFTKQFKIVDDVNEGDVLSFTNNGAEIVPILDTYEGNNVKISNGEIVVIADNTDACICLKERLDGGFVLWVDHPVVENKWCVKGTFNEWTSEELTVLVPESLTEYMYEVELDAADELIFHLGEEKFLGYSDIKSSDIGLVTTGENNNIGIAKAGTYTFYVETKEEFDSQRIGITFVPAPAQEPVNALKGSFDEWGAGIAMFADSENKAVLLNHEVTGEAQIVKVKLGDNWYSELDPAIDSGLGITLVDDGMGGTNIKLPVGTYDIYLNNSYKIYIAAHDSGSESYHGVNVVNGSFEETDTGWAKENITSIYSSSSKAAVGSRSFKLDGRFPDKTTPATMTQSVAGFKVGDKVKITFQIATYFNTLGKKTDVFTQINCMAGEQKVAATGTYPGASDKFATYTAEITLTAADIAADGSIIVGLEFICNPAASIWGYLDDFTLSIWG